MTIASLIIDIAANTAKLSSGVDEINDKLDSVTVAADKMSTFLESSFVKSIASGQLLADAFEKVGEIGLDAFKKIAEALPDLVERAMQVGNQLYEMSVKTGGSVETLSALRYVASQTGIDFQSFGDSIFKMEKFLGATGEAADKAQETLGRLGLNLVELKNEKPDEAFIDVISALEQIPNRADQAAIGAAVFGKGFKDMAGLATENIRELIDEAGKLGLVMSTDTAAAAHAAEIGFKSFEMQLDAVGIRIGAAFLPAIIGLQQNIGVVLHDSIDTANASLGKMGGGSGFLATVAKAMGTGNGAIAAQVQLYETLRDTVISLVRSAIEPSITAFSYVMVGFDAFRVLGLSVVSGYQAIAYEVERLLLASIKLKQFTDPLNAKGYQAEADSITKDLDRLYNAMAAQDKKVQDLKKSEQDWADGAKGANAEIEQALTKLGTTHTDVAAIIRKFADQSHAAYGGVGEDVETANKAAEAFEKKLQALTATIDSAVKHHVSLSDQVRMYGAEALKASEEASTWGKTVDANVQVVATSFAESKIKIESNAEALTKVGEAFKLLIPPAALVQAQVNDLTKKIKDGLGGVGEIGLKVSDGFKEGAKQIGDANRDTLRSLSDLSRALSEMGAAAGGVFGAILHGVSSMTSAISGGMKAFQDGTKAFKDGNTLSGISNMASGVMSIASAAITAGKALWDHFFGNAGRDIVSQFAETEGGFDALHAKLDALPTGVGETLWKNLTQGVGKNDPAAAKSAIDAITAALDKQKQATDDLLKTQNDDLANLLKGLEGLGAGDLLQPYLDKLADAKNLTADNLAALKALAGDATPSYEQMTKAADALGISTDHLGQSFQAAKAKADWQSVIDNLDTLVRGGADINELLGDKGLQKKISDLVTASIKFGTEIPANAKPWIESLARQGLLLDENGNKITDTSKLKFGGDLETSLQTLIDKIGILIDHLTTGVPDAISKIPKDIKVDVDVNLNAKKTGDWTGAGGGDVSTAATGGYVTTARVIPFALGGSVFGSDTVPAMLTPGEIVLNAAQQRNVAGAITGTDRDARALHREVQGLRGDLRQVMAQQAAQMQLIPGTIARTSRDAALIAAA